MKMYLALEKVNKFIDYSREMGEIMVSYPKYYDGNRKIAMFSDKGLHRIVKTINAQILGISGRVYPIIDAKYIYWNEDGIEGLSFTGFNGLEVIDRRVDVSDIYRGKSFYPGISVDDFLNHPGDYAMLKRIGGTYDSVRGYDLIHHKYAKEIKDYDLAEFRREMDVAWKCWKMYRDNVTRDSVQFCPHCGHRIYHDTGFDMVVKKCPSCAKLVVIETAAKRLGIDPSLGKASWTLNRWNQIEIDGV